jgi:hypothetical protein
MYPEAKSKKLVPYRNLTTEGFLSYRRELPRGHIRLIVPFDIVVDREPGPIDQCASPAVTEVWHSSDRQVLLDMLRIDIDGESKNLGGITFKARLESVDWNKHEIELAFS